MKKGATMKETMASSSFYNRYPLPADNNYGAAFSLSGKRSRFRCLQEQTADLFSERDSAYKPVYLAAVDRIDEMLESLPNFKTL